MTNEDLADFVLVVVTWQQTPQRGCRGEGYLVRPIGQMFFLNYNGQVVWSFEYQLVYAPNTISFAQVTDFALRLFSDCQHPTGR